MRKRIDISLAGIALLACAFSTEAANVGYYDMCAGQGNATQVASILAAGEVPVLLTDLSAADLAGIDVLYVQNCDNGGYGPEYVGRVPDIEAAVAAGMVLIIHDRFVTPAETILPGGAGFNIIRDFSDDRNIDILDNTTLVTNGPGGILDDTSLDNGTSSSHGFAVAGSLPGDSTLIFSRTNPDEIVTMCYAFEGGGGAVIYSTIPLDYYLAGFGYNPPRQNFAEIYAPNVVAYGASGACGRIEVAIDIKFCSDPNAFNCNKKGVLPVTIFGTETFDVADIDIATLRLCTEDLLVCTEAPRTYSIADRGDPNTDLGAAMCSINPETGAEEDFLNLDGYLDLDAAFEASEVQAMLGDFCGADKRTISDTLVIIGSTLDGTPINSVPVGNLGTDQLLKQNK